MKRLPVAVARIALATTGLCAAVASFAAPSAAPTGPTPQVSPEQPRPRTGSYRILDLGETAISARCDEGGFVFVARRPERGHEMKPVPGAKPPKGVSPERDAAIRAACREVDYTK